MSDYSYPYSVEVMVYLVCCFILTLSIGLMPPFFVRCMLPARPLNRGSALLLVSLFFCMNLAVCALLIAVGTYYGLKVHYAEPVSERDTLALLAQLGGANLDSPRQEEDAQLLDPAELARKVKPACVFIETFDRQRKSTGYGSGFFINKEGQVITNYHVIAGAGMVLPPLRELMEKI